MKMADKPKNTREEFFNCCEGMPVAEMMQKMRDQESGCCDFDCSEMMARMTTMCCQPQEEKEETPEEVRETQ
jgi:hypothetical protein